MLVNSGCYLGLQLKCPNKTRIFYIFQFLKFLVVLVPIGSFYSLHHFDVSQKVTKISNMNNEHQCFIQTGLDER